MVLGMTVEVLLLVKMNVFLIQTRKQSVCCLIALLHCIEGKLKFGGFQIQFNLAFAIPKLIGRTCGMLCDVHYYSCGSTPCPNRRMILQRELSLCCSRRTSWAAESLLDQG